MRPIKPGRLTGSRLTVSFTSIFVFPGINAFKGTRVERRNIPTQYWKIFESKQANLWENKSQIYGEKSWLFSDRIICQKKNKKGKNGPCLYFSGLVQSLHTTANTIACCGLYLQRQAYQVIGLLHNQMQQQLNCHDLVLDSQILQRCCCKSDM